MLAENCIFDAGTGAGSGCALRNWQTVRNCIFKNVSNAILISGGTLIEGCDISNVNTSDPNQHENGIETLYPSRLTIRNNYIHDTYAVNILVGNGVGETLDVYNNVFWNNGGAAPIDLDGRANHQGTSVARIYNNTFVHDGSVVRTSTGGFTWSVTTRNNHIIGVGNIGPIDTSNNLVQGTLEAARAGYVLANLWRPTRGTSRTVDAGTGTGTWFTSDRLGVARSQNGAWDVGAYEYIVTIPRPEPPENLHVATP